MFMGVSGQCLGPEDCQVLEAESELRDTREGSGRVEEHCDAGQVSGGWVE